MRRRPARQLTGKRLEHCERGLRLASDTMCGAQEQPRVAFGGLDVARASLIRAIRIALHVELIGEAAPGIR